MKFRMRPMSLQKSGDSSAVVSLAGLFDGKFTNAVVQGDAATMAYLVCRGEAGPKPSISLPVRHR